MTNSFLYQERFKLLATFIVASFFLYFWVNGPVQVVEEILHLETEATRFSIPKLVGEDENKTSDFKTIGSAETEGYGHGIMLEHKKEKENTGIIIDGKNEGARDAELGKEMLAHAHRLDTKSEKYELIQGADFSYVISEDKSKIYLESDERSTNIRGYAGPIRIGMFLSDEGKILEIHHLKSRETESYLRTILKKGFYSQFSSLKLSGEHSVDAVSGATLTTEAIALTATELFNNYTPDPLANLTEVNEVNKFSVEAELTWWWIAHIVIIGLIFIYGIQKKWRKTKKGILIISILSVIYIGFFLNSSFTYITFLHPFLGTSISSMVGIYALFTLLGAVWGKNTYCKYVCPFGNAQRLILKISPKKFTSKFFIPNKWINRIRGGLTMGLIVGVFLGMRSWSNFELFPDLFGLEIGSLWFIPALFMVVVAAKYPMIWCRLLCPTGSVLDAISEAVNYKPKKRQKVKA